MTGGLSRRYVAPVRALNPEARAVEGREPPSPAHHRLRLAGRPVGSERLARQDQAAALGIGDERQRPGDPVRTGRSQRQVMRVRRRVQRGRAGDRQ